MIPTAIRRCNLHLTRPQHDNIEHQKPLGATSRTCRRNHTRPRTSITCRADTLALLITQVPKTHLHHMPTFTENSHPEQATSDPSDTSTPSTRTSSQLHNDTESRRDSPQDSQIDKDLTKDQLRWKGRPTTYVFKSHQTSYNSAYTRPAVEIVRETLKRLDQERR